MAHQHGLTYGDGQIDMATMEKIVEVFEAETDSMERTLRAAINDRRAIINEAGSEDIGTSFMQGQAEGMGQGYKWALRSIMDAFEDEPEIHDRLEKCLDRMREVSWDVIVERTYSPKK